MKNSIFGARVSRATASILALCVAAACGRSKAPEAPRAAARLTAAAACPASPVPQAAPPLFYTGAIAGEYADPLALEAVLLDGFGAPAPGRVIAFTLASQPVGTSTTDAAGRARLVVTPSVAPGQVAVTAAFAGDDTLAGAQAAATIQLDREETALLYSGGPALAINAAGALSASLVEADGTPVAGRSITFAVAGVLVSAVTDASGTATATATLSSQATGPATLTASFAGDVDYKPSSVSRSVILYSAQQFVVWGGNPTPLAPGAHVNFWGAQWAAQVQSGDYVSNPSFKGYANPIASFAICEPSARNSGTPVLDLACWTTKSGNSFPPSTLPAYIGVIVSTSIGKADPISYGNISDLAIVKLDSPSTYGPAPGKAGWGTIVAFLPGGTSAAAAPQLVASQTQAPASLLPGQAFSVAATVVNVGRGGAAGVVLSETASGVARTASLGAIAAAQQVSANFTATAPLVALRGAAETSAAYLARLGSVDGNLVESFGQVSFTDVLGQAQTPVLVHSASALAVPRLSARLSAPGCVFPGQTVAYGVTVWNLGSAASAAGNAAILAPDGTSLAIAVPAIAGGASFTGAASWTVPAVAARGPTESNDAYAARLAGLDGGILSASLAVSWSDAAGNAYGTSDAAASSVERLPIVAVVAQGPETLQAGQTASVSFALTNTGSGGAFAPTVTLTGPDGAVTTATGDALAAGQGETVKMTIVAPAGTGTNLVEWAWSVTWADAAQGSYGPITGNLEVSVTGTVAPRLSIALSPATAGPDVVGTAQTLTATVTSGGLAAPGVALTFVVSGANPGTGSVTTDPTGAAVFTYTGTASGTDSAQAFAGSTASNTAQITWLVPAQPISTSTVFARFFASNNSGVFNTPPTATPAFSGFFPSINFNPPAGRVPGNTSGINENSRPFTEIVTDVNGNFAGTIVAQGNGLQAGVGPLNAFQAVFTGVFTVAAASDVVFNFFSDDGFVFGVGGGASRVSGALVNPPPSGLTAFNELTVVGSFNDPTGPVANTAVVHFPGAGSYPYELDYSECCGGELSINMTAGRSATGVPPSGALLLTPATTTSLATGQVRTFTAAATDAAGQPVAGVPVSFIVTGPNGRQFTAITDATGHATFQYTGAAVGTDVVQAGAPVNGMTAYSNIVNQAWTQGSTVVNVPVVAQGFIGAPLIGAVVQQPVTITTGPGVNLSSGTLSYWPTNDPSAVTVLNPHTTGNTTIGVFDPTVLPAGGYTIALNATSFGTTQLSEIVVSVVGENKPGRVVSEVTEFKVPLSGLTMTVSRRYDSLDRARSGDFGFGWSLGTGADLTVSASNDVTFTVDGKRQTFFFQPQALSFLFPWLLQVQYVPQSGSYGTLTSDGCQQVSLLQNSFDCLLSSDPYTASTFTYATPDGRKFVMGADGSLRSIQDLNGNVLSFTASGITSSAGGLSVPFTRDGAGRITRIVDPAGNAYSYDYDAAGNLSAVHYPAVATAETYTYDTAHLLTSETDPRGNTSSTTYGPDGRIASVTTPAVPAPDGSSVRYTTRFSYDLASNRTITTFPDGSTTVKQTDARGNVIAFTDGLGRTTTSTYDALGNLTRTVDPLGNVTSYTYDGNGNRTSTQRPGLAAETTTYTAFGAVASHTDAAGLDTWTTTYDANGNPLQTTDLFGGGAVSSTRTYDAAGRLSTWTTGTGETHRYRYTAEGRISGVTDAAGSVTTFTYDALGRTTSITDPRGGTRQLGWDEQGRRVQEIDARGVTTRYGYDENGNRSDVVEAAGTPQQRTTHTEFDALNRRWKITQADGTTRKSFHDFRGNTIAEVDELGRVTSYAYDAAGQLTTTTTATGTQISYGYDAAGRKIRQTDERGGATAFSYDAAGRQIAVQDPSGNVTRTGYDAADHRTSMTDAAGNSIVATYDARGQLVRVAYPTIPATAETYTYDGQSRPLSHTDPAGRRTTYAYDSAGRLASVTDPLGKLTSYGYDGNGNQTSITDANLHTTLIRYDARNREIGRTLPLGQSDSVSFDVLGRKASRTDFNGHTTTFSYDARDRLTGKVPDPSFGAPPVTFSYTATGRRASMSDASGVTTYAYDSLDRLSSKATPAGTLGYGWDPSGNLTSLQSSNAGGASLAYTWDASRRLSAVQDAIAGTTQYAYDAAGNPVDVALPNGLHSGDVYDALHRLTRACDAPAAPACAASTPLAGYAYTLNAAGQRTSVSEVGGRGVAYGYDDGSRLVSESVTGDADGIDGAVSYTYDAAGNRLARASSLAGVPAASYGYDADDRLAGSVTDANGNDLGGGAVWDFEDRLLSRGGVTFVYDGDGNRVAQTSAGVLTSYLVDDQNPTHLPQVIDELQGGAVTTTYGYGRRRISQAQPAAGVRYYGYDGRGSVRALFDAGGAVTDSYRYDAFGNLLASSGTTANVYRFSGEALDAATGLYWMRARYYDPARGRFLSTDPLPGVAIQPATQQRYTYAANDPVNASDPTGREVVFEYLEVLNIKPIGFTAHLVCTNDPVTGDSTCHVTHSSADEVVVHLAFSGTGFQDDVDFAYGIGKCITDFFDGFNKLFDDATSGKPLSPDEGPKLGNEYAECIQTTTYDYLGGVYGPKE